MEIGNSASWHGACLGSPDNRQQSACLNDEAAFPDRTGPGQRRPAGNSGTPFCLRQPYAGATPHEEDQAGDGRQRHGRGPYPGRTAQAQLGLLRHHGVRRRAPSQLQPHPAVPGAGRRADLRGNRPQRPQLVCGKRHQAPPRPQGGADRPGPPQGGRRGRQRGRVRPPAAGHRLGPLHPADTRQSPAGRDRLPRHRRHPGHDRLRPDPQPRGGDRRRPARPGGGQRPQATRHGRDRRAPLRLAAGTPTGPHRRQTPARRAGSPRHPLPPEHPDPGTDGQRQRPGLCRAVQRRRRDSRRPGGNGRRHPPQYRAGRKRGHPLQPRHPGQRHPADLRPTHLCGRRMRQPPWHRLRPGCAAVRAGQGLRQPPGSSRLRPLPGLGDLDQAQGDRYRPVLRRRLHRRRRQRDHHPFRPHRRRLQEAGNQGRCTGRRLSLRRHRRRRLVLPADPREPQRRADPRPPDVRRERPRRCRPPGPEQRREHARHGRSYAAATASARAPSSRPYKNTACSASTKSRNTPRPPAPVAPARDWWNRS